MEYFVLKQFQAKHLIFFTIHKVFHTNTIHSLTIVTKTMFLHRMCITIVDFVLAFRYFCLSFLATYDQT